MMATSSIRGPFTGKVAAHICRQSSFSSRKVSSQHQSFVRWQHRTVRPCRSINVRGYHYNNVTSSSIFDGHYTHQYTRAFSSSGGSSKDDDKASVSDESIDNSESEDTPDSNDAPTQDDDDDSDDNNSSSKKTHFPWRHESTPLARITEKDDYSGMPNNFRARFLRRLIACREINLTPLHAVPLPFGFVHEWERDLSNNFAVAFRLGMEELLRDVFRGKVAVENSTGGEYDEDGISIDTSVIITENEDGDASDKDGAPYLAEESNEYLKQMFDEDLLAIYQSIDPDNLHLKLSIRPIKATLQHIFAVPLLSRDIVRKRPHLKGAYQRIEEAFAEKKSYNDVKKMTFDLADEIGENDAFTRTVICDATIVCEEYFQVKSASGSGFILKGMPDGAEEEEVVHTVRFEVTTTKNDDDDDGEPKPGRKVGSWKIIDIDDQLDGNVFH